MFNLSRSFFHMNKYMGESSESQVNKNNRLLSVIFISAEREGFDLPVLSKIFVLLTQFY